MVIFLPLISYLSWQGVSRLVRYLCFSAILITLIIYFKNIVLQTILIFILPLSDFRSTLIEISILIIGILTCFLFFSLGYYAHRFFDVNTRSFIIFVHLLFSPILMSNWFNNVEWLYNWSRLSLDLLAEPYRILTFTNQFGDLLGLFLPILLMGTGALIHFQERRKTGNLLRVQKIEA